MPTTFYNPSNGVPSVTPAAWSALWDGAATQTRAGATQAFPTGRSIFATTFRSAGNVGTEQFRNSDRWVIGPLAAQTISGTLRGVVKCRESSASFNGTIAIAAKIIQPDGADRHVLLAVSASDDTSTAPPELNASASVFQTRKFLDVSENDALALTEGAAEEGDFLVIEFGFREVTTTTSLQGHWQYGQEAETDFAHDDALTTNLNGWVKFSGDIALLPSDQVQLTQFRREVAYGAILQGSGSKGNAGGNNVSTVLTTKAACVWVANGAFDTTDADRVISAMEFDSVAMTLADGENDDAANLSSSIYFQNRVTEAIAKTLAVTYAGTVDAPLMAWGMLPPLAADPIGGVASTTLGNDSSPQLAVTAEDDNSIIVMSFLIKGVSVSAFTYTPDSGWEIIQEAINNSTTEALLVIAKRNTAAGSQTGGITIGLGLGSITNVQVVGTEFLLEEALPTPTITTIAPASGEPGATISVVITGTGFLDGLTVDFGEGVTIDSITVDSGTQITVEITIGTTAPLAPRDVVVTNPGDLAVTLVGGFTVTVGGDTMPLMGVAF